MRADLAEEIARAAVSAAREDPRSSRPRVRAPDLISRSPCSGLLERSIRAKNPNATVIGRHGLVVERQRRGLLLPQVAPEWGWDRDTFLAHTCTKAGLPADAWKNGAKVYRFDAEVFGD